MSFFLDSVNLNLGNHPVKANGGALRERTPTNAHPLSVLNPRTLPRIWGSWEPFAFGQLEALSLAFV